MAKKTPVTNFSEIESPQDLIAYLSHSTDRLDNTKNNSTQYVYHYTKLCNVVSIINNRRWWLKSPKTMNDGLEFQHISESKQNKTVFFASFVYNLSESIAMWSMYAQPWEDGVYIRIPVKQFKEWKNNTEIIYTVHRTETKESLIPVENLSIVRVAYTNADSVQSESKEILRCGKAENTNLKNTPDLPDLMGYIKDMAWEYEQEVRMLAAVDKSIECDGLAIEVTDDLIDSMEIVAGPRFSGDLYERIRREVDRQLKTDDSLFSGKLTWIPCDNCLRNTKVNFQTKEKC